MRDRTPLGIAALVLTLAACAPAARRATIEPRAHPEARFVIGRIEMLRDGRAQAVTKAGLGAALNPGPLATLSVQRNGGDQRFAIPIENDQGWFAAQLPPGTYTASMQYYIWVFGTPVQIGVPPDVERCYLGTLTMNLFARSSTAGVWARTAGGAIPTDDIDFAVIDQSPDVTSYAGVSVPACPMTLPAPARAHPP